MGNETAAYNRTTGPRHFFLLGSYESQYTKVKKGRLFVDALFLNTPLRNAEGNYEALKQSNNEQSTGMLGKPQICI